MALTYIHTSYESFYVFDLPFRAQTKSPCWRTKIKSCTREDVQTDRVCFSVTSITYVCTLHIYECCKELVHACCAIALGRTIILLANSIRLFAAISATAFLLFSLKFEMGVVVDDRRACNFFSFFGVFFFLSFIHGCMGNWQFLGIQCAYHVYYICIFEQQLNSASASSSTNILESVSDCCSWCYCCWWCC